MQRLVGLVQACSAMAMVGGAVTASAFLTDYPRLGAQAVRYGAAALVLALVHRRSRWRVVRPVGTDWWWLTGSATAGLTVYNLAVVRALETAEPTVVATIVSWVPLVLAFGAPLVARRPVPIPLLAAAVAVVAGAVVVQGGGRSDPAGIGFSLLALAGESGFTLLSLPVMARVGPFAVALHTSWIAALQLAVLALVRDGCDALAAPSPAVLAAIAYLAVASALAFALWFAAVDGIGGDVAGLAAGLIPAAAVASGVPLGVATLDTRAVAGTALVVAGLVAGLRSVRRRGLEPAETSSGHVTPRGDPVARRRGG